MEDIEVVVRSAPWKGKSTVAEMIKTALVANAIKANLSDTNSLTGLEEGPIDYNSICDRIESINAQGTEVNIRTENVLDKKEIPTDQISDGYHTFDELYEHRTALFCLVCKWSIEHGHFFWMSDKHSDGTMFNNMFVAGIQTTTKTMTYHIEMEYWDKFVKAGAEVLANAPEWDGHTSQDVVNSLFEMI